VEVMQVMVNVVAVAEHDLACSQPYVRQCLPQSLWLV